MPIRPSSGWIGTGVDGQRDSSFSYGGPDDYDSGGFVAGPLVLHDGRLWVLTINAAARLLPDGRPDTSFGNHGVVDLAALLLAKLGPGGDPRSFRVESAVARDDGYVVIACNGLVSTAAGSSRAWALALLDADGRLVNEFGSGGQGVSLFKAGDVAARRAASHRPWSRCDSTSASAARCSLGRPHRYRCRRRSAAKARCRIAAEVERRRPTPRGPGAGLRRLVQPRRSDTGRCTTRSGARGAVRHGGAAEARPIARHLPRNPRGHVDHRGERRGGWRGVDPGDPQRRDARRGQRALRRHLLRVRPSPRRAATRLRGSTTNPSRDDSNGPTARPA